MRERRSSMQGTELCRSVPRESPSALFPCVGASLLHLLNSTCTLRFIKFAIKQPKMSFGEAIEADPPKALFLFDHCDAQSKERHCSPMALLNEHLGQFVGREQFASQFDTAKLDSLERICQFVPAESSTRPAANAELRVEYLSHGDQQCVVDSMGPFVPQQRHAHRRLSEPLEDNTQSLVRMCKGCEMAIHDRHLFCVHRPRHSANCDDATGTEDEYWHESCLKCCQCDRQLDNGQSCFLRGGRVYCREDYSKSFGTPCHSPKCSRCALPIEPADFFFRSNSSNVFHTHCFNCSCCGNALTKGEQYINVAGELICQRDLSLIQLQQQLNTGDIAAGGALLGMHPIRQETPQKEPPRFHHISPFPDLDFCSLQRPIFHHHSHHHGDRSKKIPKRPRTILNAPQRKAFKSAFEKGPKPSRKVREQLARETGLSVRVVQVWFQNQRAKMKKERKRELDKLQSTGRRDSMSTSTDSEKKEDSDQTMLKSPQSETSEKSDIVANDDDSDECEEFEEEHNGSTNVEVQNTEKIQSKQQNPIEKIHNMCQNYFPFV